MTSNNIACADSNCAASVHAVAVFLIILAAVLLAYVMQLPPSLKPTNAPVSVQSSV